MADYSERDEFDSVPRTGTHNRPRRESRHPRNPGIQSPTRGGSLPEICRWIRDRSARTAISYATSNLNTYSE